MKTEEHERAADLIAILMRDSAARAAFRRSPSAMAREHGLDDVAEELAGRDGALQSLDVRESRSSVAGVLIAAAAEGVAFFSFIEDAHADSGGGGSFSPDVARIVALTRPRMPAVVPGGNGLAVEHAVQGGGGGGSGGGGGDAPVDDPPATNGATEPPPVDAGAGAAAPPAAVPDAGAAVVDAGAAPAAVPVHLDLLHDPRLALGDTAAQALASAGPDSRTSQILESLVAHHTVSVGTISPDGSFTITMVDGAPVDPANIAARDLAQQLAGLDPSLRPTVVYTPWKMAGDTFYSDEAHRHHIEVGFGDPPPKPAATAVAAPAADPGRRPGAGRTCRRRRARRRPRARGRSRARGTRGRGRAR